MRREGRRERLRDLTSGYGYAHLDRGRDDHVRGIRFGQDVDARPPGYADENTCVHDHVHARAGADGRYHHDDGYDRGDVCADGHVRVDVGVP